MGFESAASKQARRLVSAAFELDAKLGFYAVIASRARL
jgi:hypothetical protein